MDDTPRNDYSGADQENKNRKTLSSDTRASEKQLMDAVKKASGGNAGNTTQRPKAKAAAGKKPVKKKATDDVPKAEKTASEDSQEIKKKVSADLQSAPKKSEDDTRKVKKKAADDSKKFRKTSDDTQSVRKSSDNSQKVRKTSDDTQRVRKDTGKSTNKKADSDNMKPESDDLDLLLDDEDTSQAANESAARTRRRAAAKRAEEERRERISRMISIGLLVVIIILAIVLLTKIFGGKKDSAKQAAAQGTETAAGTVMTDSTNAADTGETASGSAENAAAEDTAQTESTTDLGYDPNNPAGLSDEVLADPRSVFAVSPYVTDWNMESNGTKTVYLTFDDGPSYLTEQFLDVLDQYDVKATFFVTNQSPEYSYMIAEAYKRGHTIGMHTSSHSFEIYTSEEDYFFDLQEIANVVHDQIGYVPCFIRFPGGSSNTRSRRYSEGIMAKLAEEVQARGYQYYDWNGECGDGNMLSAEEEVAMALDCSAENIIMLCHDGPMKEATLEALPGIIEGYLDRGYVFAPIDRDTMVVHHEILN